MAEGLAAGRCSSRAGAAASGSRSPCAPRVTAPTSRCSPRPPSRTRSSPGTIYTAAEEIEAAGGTALPIVGDVRDPDSVAGAVEQAAERFGGIDILVNNASAISLTPIEQTEPKRYDLMQNINVRGTFLAIRACIPHLKRSDNGHILTLSPPLNLEPRWLGGHAAYTLSKYGMTPAHARGGRGAARGRRRRQHAVAAHDHRDRRGAEPARRRRGDGQGAHAARSTPIRLRDHHQARARVHRPDADRRRGAAAEGITDLEPYRAGPGDDQLIGDLFVDDAPLAG